MRISEYFLPDTHIYGEPSPVHRQNLLSAPIKCWCTGKKKTDRDHLNELNFPEPKKASKMKFGSNRSRDPARLQIGL